jgi:murein DD-endopeptidase MepM/ murein hydrolase activator NlpD
MRVLRRGATALACSVLLMGCGQYAGIHHALPESLDAALAVRERAVPHDAFTSGERSTFGSIGRFSGSLSEGLVRRPLHEQPGEGSEREGGVTGRGTTLVDTNGDGVPDSGTLFVRLQGDGPLYACPVQGHGYFTSSFGAYRAGPPIHPHQGNDMMAPYGTPVVASFSGVAVATPNLLGGLAVTVYGAEGYAYNAHLAAYGKLGPVEVGDPIGFVGDSGNARGSPPHDHFEWHPGAGPAVDPFPFLDEAC